MVSDRTPGTYTCTIRGPNDQILSSINFTVQGICTMQTNAMYMYMQQTECSNQLIFFLPSFCSPCGCCSYSVQFLWPSGGANIITGCRIFYGNGRNLLFSSYVTSIVLNFVESGQIESVSICSESEQLPSELISVTVKITGTLVIIIVFNTNNTQGHGSLFIR